MHLATHGLVDAGDPSRSSVALAASDGEDGYLHTLEILATPMQCELVVMSACESALTLARSRMQGGKPLIEQQMVQLKIGRMTMLTEALRSYVLRVAWEHDQKLPSTNAGFVMNFSTEVIQEVTQLNMELHGAAGFTMDAHANKLVRDGIIWTHLAGDTVQRMKVVRRLTKAAK